MFETVAMNVVAALSTIALYKILVASGIYIVLYTALLYWATHSSFGVTVFFAITVYSVIMLFVWVIGLIASHVPEVKQAGRKLLAVLLVGIAIALVAFLSSSERALIPLAYAFFFANLAHAIGALHLYGGRILDA